jgi:hypothetical protein
VFLFEKARIVISLMIHYVDETLVPENVGQIPGATWFKASMKTENVPPS